MAAVRHFEFAKFWHFDTWPSLETKFESAHQISSKSGDSRPRYSDKTVFKMAAVRHLEFQNLVFWSCDLCLNVILLLHTKFRINRTINIRDIAKRRFSIWRPSAILELLWRHHIASENFILRPNFVLNFHGVRFRNFWNILYFMFQHFGLKLPISGLMWTIFGEK